MPDQPGGTSPLRPAQLDPRGPRFAAILTTVVLAVILLLAPSTLANVLLAAQAVVFGIGAFVSPASTPYSWIYRRAVRPRLEPPTELEDAAPVRFAQTVGFGFVLLALAAFLLGADVVGLVATGFALAAAFLNGAFGYCLGCEIYLLYRRTTTHKTPTGTSPVATKG